MKKIGLVLILSLLLSLFSLSAQSREEWEGLVNFDITLEKLSSVASDMAQLEQIAGRLLILRGTVGSRQVLVNEGDNYQAELELISGEWLGVEEVKMYSALLLLTGPEFANAVPARRSRNPHPDEIPLNADVLAVCQLVGVTERSGKVLTVLDVYDLRIID